MDVYDVTKNWNKVFRLFSLSRIEKVNGKIVIKNNKRKAFLTIFSYVAMTILCVVPRAIFVYINFAQKSITVDVIYTSITTLQIPLSILIATSESSKNIKAYFLNYRTIDKVLNVKPSSYAIEEKKFNKYLWYFGCLIMISLISDLTAWFIIHGVGSSVTRLPYFVSQCIIHIQYCLIILNLKIFGGCLSIVLNRSKEILRITCLSKARNIRSNAVLPYDCRLGKGFEITEGQVSRRLKQLSECYMLLGDQCGILNNRHGLQLIIAFASTAVHLTILCHIMINHYVHINMTCSTWIVIFNKLLRALHETSLLVLLLREAVIVQRLRTLFLSALDKAIVNNNLTPRDKDSVIEFGTIIQRHALIFTANDYFNLDYSVFHQILTALITYTVILVQLN